MEDAKVLSEEGIWEKHPIEMLRYNKSVERYQKILLKKFLIVNTNCKLFTYGVIVDQVKQGNVMKITQIYIESTMETVRDVYGLMDIMDKKPFYLMTLEVQ